MTDVQITDPWKLSSGLRDDMVFQIHAAYFAPDADYQGGKVLLLHLIGIDELEEPNTIKMSVGADWESADGGVTITHPTKKRQAINQSTIYGHWISHAQEIPELVKVLQSRGNPTNAKVWEGLIIHLLERELVFGKNIEPQKRLMPAEYFGLLEAQPPATIPSVPTATAPAPVGVPQVPVQAPPVQAPAAPPATAGADPQALLAQARAAAAAQNNASPLYTELVNLARSTEWPDFLSTILSDPRVLADDELAQQAIDPTQLYAQARA